jgi:hypothetical protein
MSTIYIAIPTLEDNQLVGTVYDAITNADNPEALTIGVAYTTPKRYYKKEIKSFKTYPQVITKWLDPVFNLGVGKGRNAALSMYSGQDYVLQVDSHTKFEKGWDTCLINMYKEALKETNNDKTIITSYVSGYVQHKGEEREIFDLECRPRYSHFIRIDNKNSKAKLSTCDFNWSDDRVDTHPWPHALRKTTPFLPAVKFSAQFVFANKHFVEYNGLPEHILFWEEELVQTINLLDKGFSLVFPNQYVPITHLFTQFAFREDKKNVSYRVNFFEKTKSLEADVAKVSKNYGDFIADPKNKEKVAKFYAYANMTSSGLLKHQHWIPPDYNR